MAKTATVPAGTASRQRDRSRTAAAILTAARELLAEQGFQGLGVNAVARRAACDKQLIYRYFGGIDGLVDAIGADLADWIGDAVDGAAAVDVTDYATLTEQLVVRFMHALRRDPLVQKIVVWELSEPSPLVARLAAARTLALGSWMARQRGTLTPPPGIDAPAVNALLIGAVQMLVLSAATTGGFAGMALKDPADWDRVEAAVRRLARAVYGGEAEG